MNSHKDALRDITVPNLWRNVSKLDDVWSPTSGGSSFRDRRLPKRAYDDLFKLSPNYYVAIL